MLGLTRVWCNHRQSNGGDYEGNNLPALKQKAPVARLKKLDAASVAYHETQCSQACNTPSHHVVNKEPGHGPSRRPFTPRQLAVTSIYNGQSNLCLVVTHTKRHLTGVRGFVRAGRYEGTVVERLFRDARLHVQEFQPSIPCQLEIGRGVFALLLLDVGLAAERNRKFLTWKKLIGTKTMNVYVKRMVLYQFAGRSMILGPPNLKRRGRMKGSYWPHFS